MKSDVARRCYGKYRGKVLNNRDPLGLARLMVDVPAMPGVKLSWALPCSPYAGPLVGWIAIPPLGANVWVEFEEGDPSHPIWTGCFWTELEMKALAIKVNKSPAPAAPEKKIFKTESVTLIVDDTPAVGGLTLKVEPPAVTVPSTITIDAQGLTIEVGVAMAKIAMMPQSITATVPPATASMNPKGLSVTASAVDVTAAKTSVTGQVEVTGTAKITGQTTMEGPVSVTGNFSVTGPASVTGPSSFNGPATVAGPTTISGALTVAGAATVAGAVVAASLHGAPLP